VLGGGGRQRAHHAEGGEVDALELQPGLAGGGHEPLDHLAADRDDHHARARAGRGVDDAERLEVDDGLVHRHRDVVGRLLLDRRGEALGVLDHGQVERAHDDPLVGDAEAHAPRQVVGLEELAKRLGQGGRVGGLAVPQDAGPQRDDRALLDGHAAVDLHFGGGDVAGVEVEPDDGGGALILLEHDLSYRQGAGGS
jgi:hypothetical protein